LAGERLPLAVFFIDERGRVLFYNDAANRLLTQRDGIVLTGLQRLGATRASDDAALQRLVREACAMSIGKGERPGGVLQIRRPSNRRPYAMIVAPLGLRQWPFLSKRPAAVVFVSDPEHIVHPPAEHLASLFGLTPAEARLAAALAARLSVEDYAEQAKITIGTARWTLKRVLEKTGCRRQSELVHLLATSVAGLVVP
jgi:DNA-binding CsgD family transcriptional regulator